MAFSYTTKTDFPDCIGRYKICSGTFANAGGSTGGDIATGLRRVLHFSLSHTGAAVVASAPAVDETMPLESGTVTIVTVADTNGTWMAFGE